MLKENAPKEQKIELTRQKLAGDKYRNISYLIRKLENMETILKSENMEGKCLFPFLLGCSITQRRIRS